MAATYPVNASPPLPDTRWRTRDIVIAAVIGVAFGVAFWAFGVVWKALEGAGPLLNVMYGIWLMPAIVALMQWGDMYLQGDLGPAVALSHLGCGATVSTEVICGAGHVLGPGEISMRPAAPTVLSAAVGADTSS